MIYTSENVYEQPLGTNKLSSIQIGNYYYVPWFLFLFLFFRITWVFLNIYTTLDIYTL